MSQRVSPDEVPILKCCNCTRVARYRIRQAFRRAAEGKVVCDRNSCWGLVTGGYPAEGVRITSATEARRLSRLETRRAWRARRRAEAEVEAS